MSTRQIPSYVVPRWGENAVITGASRGLGRALAKELARRGARIVAVARGSEALDALVREIRAEGGAAHGINADVADKYAAHRIAQVAAELVGSIDLLVNNASTLGPVPLVDLNDLSCEALEATFAANVMGPFRLTKIALGPMLLRGRGTVLNLSSDAAVSAYAKWGAYSASKAALDHLTRVWAEETAGSGVRIVSIDPGEMDTQMHQDAMPEADRATLAHPTAVAGTIADWLERGDVNSGTRHVVNGGAL